MNQAIRFHKEIMQDGWVNAQKGNHLTKDLMISWFKHIPNRHRGRSTRGIIKISGKTIWFKDGSELRLK